ncbi:dienelactone hydrolase family protein [Sphingomonas sp. AR_OL41]|uniref:dienelactone hydrolase family protein n=1 Tax=Sphingomonas sp. AR_OL41 TaxID=3042729 RepID=UPI0024813100|nr:dienelactone hydrolase family protein [Sphingomonas sp. AR_OL41]MDH7972847.1 dienelactone hydrolase family protein [Sphingomonas sp. AR_OL41]
MSDYIQVTTPGGTFNALIVRPAEPVAPVVLVLQEIFGINDDMKATCQELADRGYIAICPDLFWRQEPGLSLSHWTDAEWKKGMELYAAFDIDKGISDIGETIGLARSLRGSSGKVGVMGYCLGGLMTFLTAARLGADAAVAYYPGGADKYVDEAGGIASPFMVHLGEEDEFISKDAQRAIKQVLADNPHAMAFSYPGCNHAFARHSGTHYDPAAADLANGRTAKFLDGHLR